MSTPRLRRPMRMGSVEGYCPPLSNLAAFVETCNHLAPGPSLSLSLHLTPIPWPSFGSLWFVLFVVVCRSPSPLLCVCTSHPFPGRLPLPYHLCCLSLTLLSLLFRVSLFFLTLPSPPRCLHASYWVYLHASYIAEGERRGQGDRQGLPKRSVLRTGMLPSSSVVWFYSRTPLACCAVVRQSQPWKWRMASVLWYSGKADSDSTANTKYSLNIALFFHPT